MKFGIVFSGVVAGVDPVKGVSGIDSINRSSYDKSTGSNVQNINAAFFNLVKNGFHEFT